MTSPAGWPGSTTRSRLATTPTTARWPGPSRREMQQIHRADGRDGGYGFGLGVIHDERFGTVVSHSGGLPGYGSNMRWLPGRRVGVVALANATYAPMGEAGAASCSASSTTTGSCRRPWCR